MVPDRRTCCCFTNHARYHPCPFNVQTLSVVLQGSNFMVPPSVHTPHFVPLDARKNAPHFGLQLRSPPWHLLPQWEITVTSVSNDLDP